MNYKLFGKKVLITLFLTSLVGINFYLYRAEFKPLVDPNDNVFQYALVDEAVKVWKQVFAGNLSPLYLLDSWQERWAEGFALSNYYSHLPQAVIGLISIVGNIDPYALFVWIRTLMLIFLPIMFFWGARILGLPRSASLVVALFSQTIFTNGLYGIDASSFLWRGWGLSSQLMALFFMPLAFGYALRYLESPTSRKASLGKAIVFNFIVAQMHFGMFSLLLLGYGLYLPYVLLSHFCSFLTLDQFKVQSSKLKQLIKQEVLPWFKFIFLTLFSLAYFIVPFFLQAQYRNFSVWDPIWKFDSWGLKQSIIWLLNGDFFDYGRFPVISLTVICGTLWGLSRMFAKSKGTSVFSNDERTNYELRTSMTGFMSILFGFYFLLFSGKTTLGNLINLIPGMSEYHQHRIIVMVQFIGVFLGGRFVYDLFKKLDTVFFALVGVLARFQLAAHLPRSLKKGIFASLLFVTSFFIIYYLEQPLVNYAKDNTVWIDRSNRAYQYDLPAYTKIKDKLETLPKGRLNVGKPGNWGRQFTVGETPLYMQMSQDGFPVIGFLPESWSPNSDTEQFFDENNQDFYNLYNVRYSILPQAIKPPAFAKLITTQGKYNLYQIKTMGWFDWGKSNIMVRSKKTDLLNITRLWFGSDLIKDKNYPVIDLSSDRSDEPTQEWAGKLWQIQMTDKNNFVNLNDKKERNIWLADPMKVTYTNTVRPSNNGTFTLKNEEVVPNGYKVHLEANKDCTNCILILKQSYHPNWELKINREKVQTFPVFPFYIGVLLENKGSYTIEATYRQIFLKKILLVLEILFLIFLVSHVLFRKTNTRLRS